MKNTNTPFEPAAAGVDADADPTLDGDVARLLESLEDDAPPPGAEAALLARIDAGDTAPSTGTKGTSAKTFALVAGLLVLAGLGVTAGTRGDSTTSSSTPVQSPAVVLPSAAEEPEPARPTAATATPAPPPPPDSASPRTLRAASPPSHAPRTTPAPSASVVVVANEDSFREQLAIVESARHSLSQGNTAECLATLRRYEEKYPSRLFAMEARVVRTEALLAAGESEKAFTLARELIAAEPRGPYADRLRALLPRTDGLDR